MSSDPKLPNKILRRERELRGWTLQYVADQLYKLCEKEGRESNISADIVGRWERGTNIPQLHYQAKLCRLYRKSTTVELGFVEQQVGSVLPPSDPHASQGIPHSRVSSVVSRAFDEQDQNSAHAQPVATQQPFILEEGNTTMSSMTHLLRNMGCTRIETHQHEKRIGGKLLMLNSFTDVTRSF
jgi:transcriptional regulator with XRE-family HTH domain